MTRKELAQAMRTTIQRPEIIEDKNTYITVYEGECSVCALGAALVAHYNGDTVKAEATLKEAIDNLFMPRYGYRAIAPLLGISIELARNISDRHDSGWSIKKIAQWLESDPDWAEGWEDNANV